MAVIIHLLGDADLGLGKGDARDDIEMALRSGSVENKRSVLTGPSREESEHREFRPLDSVINHLQLLEPELLSEGSHRIVLVATEQDPPHPQDTVPIGRAFIEVSDHDGHLFGLNAHVEMVTVDRMSADAFATAIESWATEQQPHVGATQDVVVGIAGGPVTASIGTIGGLLRAGIVPMLLEANRQDQGFAIDRPLVTAEADLLARLVRIRHYEAVRALLPADDASRRRLCRVLHQATRGSWPAKQQPLSGKRDEYTSAAAALDVPRSARGEMQAPNDRDGWARWRSSVERVVVAELSNEETAAFPLLELALRCRLNAEFAGNETALEEGRRLVRPALLGDRVSHEARRALGDLDIRRHIDAVVSQRRDATPEQFTEAFTSGLVGQISDRVEMAYRGASKQSGQLDAADVVTHHLFHRKPERFPEPLRLLMTPGRRQWIDLATRARHRLDPASTIAVRELLVDEGVTGRDDTAEQSAVRLLGYVPPAPLDADRHLVLMGVGLQNQGNDDPMIAAVLRHFGDVPIHVMLVASGAGANPTSVVAEALKGQIEQRERATASVVDCAAVASIAAVRTAIAEALTEVDPFDVCSVHVITGPGTKAMNLGACMVGVEQSFALAVPMELLSLRILQGGADSAVEPIAAASSGWQRLITDENVGHVLRNAIERLDLGLARTTLDLASSNWEPVRQLVAELTELVESSLRGGPAADSDRRDALTAARVQQAFLRRDDEPLLAVSRIAAILSDRLPDEGPTRWQKKPVPGKLWTARVDALKSPWNGVSWNFDLTSVLAGVGLTLPYPSPIDELMRTINREIRTVLEGDGDDSSGAFSDDEVQTSSDDEGVVQGTNEPSPNHETPHTESTGGLTNVAASEPTDAASDAAGSIDDPEAHPVSEGVSVPTAVDRADSVSTSNGEDLSGADRPDSDVDSPEVAPEAAPEVAPEMAPDEPVRAELVNLTPHPVTIIGADGAQLSVPVSGPAARTDIVRGDLHDVVVGSTTVSIGWSSNLGMVTNLPDPRPNVLIIVARMVADALPDRADLVFPDDLVRDEHGGVVGCRRLSCLAVPPGAKPGG